MKNEKLNRIGNFYADLIKKKYSGDCKMKIEVCIQCGKEFGASLDDGAFSGNDNQLCEDCRLKPSKIGSPRGDQGQDHLMNSHND